MFSPLKFDYAEPDVPFLHARDVDATSSDQRVPLRAFDPTTHQALRPFKHSHPAHT